MTSSASEIREKVGAKTANISEAIKDLVALGYLHRPGWDLQRPGKENGKKAKAIVYTGPR